MAIDKVYPPAVLTITDPVDVYAAVDNMSVSEVAIEELTKVDELPKE